MSYHGSTTSQSTTNTQGRQAPPGFHYMPDGTLMADSEMREQAPLQQVVPGELVITSFEMDFSSITAAGETRSFVVSGSRGSTFEVEVKNEDNYYYNFHTKEFQSAKSVLSRLLTSGDFYGNITFPTVTDNDQYDISITATKDTKHSDYYEARFGDGSMDINSTTGSNSRLMTKVIYQYVDLVLTINPYSSGGTITGTAANDTVAISAGAGLTEAVAFSTTFTVANDKALQIIKQPTHLDILSFVEPVVGAAPVDIPGENTYPTATTAFTGDDVNGAITSGAIVEIDADVAGNVVIGDKITTPVTTDTVNGAVTSGVTVTMDAVTNTKMAVGDRVTGNSTLDRSIITVAAVSAESVNVFTLSEAVAIADGVSLTFSSKINRSLTTVLNLDPSGEAKQFTMSQDIQFRDNAPLTFFNQMNYRWPVNNFAHVLKPGFIFVEGATGLVDGSKLAKYSDTTTVFAGTEQEKVYTNYEVEAVDTLSLKPVITNGEVTTQAGAITFDRQQPRSIAGVTLKAGGYGQNEILSVFGYDVRFTDLEIALTAVTTTTTAAVNNSTSVPVASRNGILDDISTVSGIGINPSLADPTVDTGAGAVTGAGTLVLTAAQTLEDGATLTFANAGLVATITGNIHVLKAGTASQSLRFDIDNLLSIT